MNILSTSPTHTQKIAEQLSQKLKAQDVVALIGELGAGKTCFTKGLMRGLAVTARAVTSPTFVLVNEYQGRLPVYHFDVYRINHVNEMIALGYEEYFDGPGITIVEWADKIEPLLPERTVRVTLELQGSQERTIIIQ